MTRIHFFKKSSQVLKETSHQLLKVIEISGKESEGLNVEELRKQWEFIRKDLESIFSSYENIKPPSKYIFCYRRIINLLVDFQELVTLKTEFLSSLNNLDEIKIQYYQKKIAQRTKNLMDEFKDIDLEVKKQLS